MKQPKKLFDIDVPAPAGIVKKATPESVSNQPHVTTEAALAGYDYLKENSDKGVKKPTLSERRALALKMVERYQQKNSRKGATKTTLTHQLSVTMHDEALNLRERRAVALKIVELMYGEERHRYPDVPYTEYKEGHFWVLDNHNDWFLHFSEEDETHFTVRHRDPQERHMLILGGLQAAIDCGGLAGVLAAA